MYLLSGFQLEEVEWWLGSNKWQSVVSKANGLLPLDRYVVVGGLSFHCEWWSAKLKAGQFYPSPTSVAGTLPTIIVKSRVKSRIYQLHSSFLLMSDAPLLA